MTPRTVKADAEVRRGRFAKAEQFAAAARLVDALAEESDEVADAYVTLCVHAGIAAADVVCAARLGEHARGENHDDAVTLLATVAKQAAVHLRGLLGMKTLAGYGYTSIQSRPCSPGGSGHGRADRGGTRRPVTSSQAVALVG